MRAAAARAPSLKTVAAAAGVAISTVSRALTRPERVNKTTRDHIFKVAGDLGYAPNIAARTLRAGAPKVILVAMPGAADAEISSVLQDMVAGIQARAQSRGIAVMIANTDGSPGAAKHVLDLALGRAISGAILVACDPPGTNTHQLTDVDLPLVSIATDLSPQGIPSFVVNDRNAVAEVIAEMGSLGHRRFCYISGPAAFHANERRRGVLEGLTALGLEGYGLSTFDATFSVDSGRALARRFVNLVPRPTAVFVWSDEVAIGFMRGLTDAGLSVPGDVSVVGFDGLKIGQYVVPSLASVHQDRRALGVAGMDALLRALDGNPLPGVRHLMSTTFQPGGSLGPAPGSAA